MRALVVILLILLIILHQDFWWWDDADPLIFGFIPIGLAWHVGISIAAGVVWFMCFWVGCERLHGLTRFRLLYS